LDSVVTTAWTTRPETRDDVSAIREVNLAAFPTAAEADLVEALRASDAWIEGLSIVTEDPEGTVVGHALLTRCHVDGAPALALAPCAVQPHVQRSGAGSAAIRAGLEAARAKGENLVLVLGHADYPRFGFTPAAAVGIRASFDVPDEAVMALARTPTPKHRREPSPTRRRSTSEHLLRHARRLAWYGPASRGGWSSLASGP
jgi:predicted N-acetyltransferase YhbS